MRVVRKLDLDRRLEAYFATLRTSSLKETLQRGVGNWQIYAAVTGSAMAMVTSASASLIGSGLRELAPDRAASVRAAKQALASSKDVPFINAIRLAMAGQNRGARSLKGADGNISRANQAQAPSISPGGVVPLCGTANVIQPGELVSIFGTNLASGTAVWDGDFPTSLGGTRVEINGKNAYLLYVSPGQINLQAPDDTARGTVSVLVITAAGTAHSIVTMAQFSPSFDLFDTRHVAGIILRSDGSGAYGGGTYDILGPTGSSLGYPTVAAQAGDIVELFAVGLGPTTPAVPAGQAFSGAASVNDTVRLYINNILVEPSFVGLSSAGLYQINLTIPSGLGEGEVPIEAIVGSMRTEKGALFSLQSSGVVANPVTSGGSTFFPGPGSVGGPPGPGSFGPPGPGSVGGPGPGSVGGSPGPGSFGGSSGGGSGSGFGGGAGSALLRTPQGGGPYEPRLRFTPT